MQKVPKRPMQDQRFVDEIRMNSEFTNIVFSEYEDPEKKDTESTPVVRKKLVYTRDYLKELSQQNDNIVVLPPNCRYLEKLNKGYLAVIEEPPAFRTIKINKDLTDEITRLEQSGKLDEYGFDLKDLGRAPHQFTLAFPYVIFILWINESNTPSYGEVYFRTQQLIGTSDALFKAPLMNIADNQSICFGESFAVKQTSLNAAIQHAIMVFWAAEFNPDYHYNYDAYQNVANVNTYIEWAILSEKNPMFIYNVDWIKMPMNLLQALERTKNNLGLLGKGSLTYGELKHIMEGPKDSGKDGKVKRSSKKFYRLYFDLANELPISSEFINVGDPIKFKTKTMHLYSLGGFREGGGIRYILMLYNGKKVLMKLTNPLKRYLLKTIQETKYAKSAILSNGLEIKSKDIIFFKSPSGIKIYKKVNYIRKAADNQLEVNLGGDYYFLDRIRDAEKFDTTNPTYHGLKLNRDKQFIHVHDARKIKNPLIKAVKVTFRRVDVVRDRVVLRFRMEQGDNYTLNLEGDIASHRTLFSIDELDKIETPFRIGRKIYSAVDKYNDQSCHNPEIVFRSEDKIFIDEFGKTKKPSSADTAKLLVDDTLYIPGQIMDIYFSLNDQVVVADWEHPLDMLSVKTIQGFKHDKTTGNISILLQNKHGELSEQPYIHNGYVLAGKVRKVVTKTDDLSAGTKIQAKVTRIANFPKKDVNIIVAFVVDTGGEPLVLCSNGCTLWYSDVMEKFNHISMKNPSWKTMQHVPIDLSKIKFQAGDIIRSVNYFANDCGYLLHEPSATRSLRITPLTSFEELPNGYNSLVFDKYQMAESILDCIPEPRVSQTTIKDDQVFNGFPTFHGTYVVSKRSPLQFMGDKGVLNVPSVCE